MPSSTRTPSTADVVAKMLRDQIFSGKLLPGARLVEGKISEEIGVSRVPVREALHALASEGVVTIEPRKGQSFHHFLISKLMN